MMVMTVVSLTKQHLLYLLSALQMAPYLLSASTELASLTSTVASACLSK